MRDLAILFIHLIVTLARLLRPGGVRGIVAESLLIKQQLLIASRSRTDTLPRYLGTDHDPLFEFHRWKANLRILDVAEVRTVPYVPLSHPFVERLIGTMRREFLDLAQFWTTRDPERKFASFMGYYNRKRVHRALDGALPDRESPTKVAHLDVYRWESCCRGLYQLPVAA